MRKGGDGGFTLVELMVTVGCIAVLGAVAVPRLRGYVLEARLNGAKPYLLEIAARERMYKVETGKYCCTAYNETDETTLANTLPASISEAGDFCFVVVCTSSTLCEAPGSRSFIDNSSTPDFEVWAVLRNSATASRVGTYGGGTCTPTVGTGLTKAPPTDWVQTGSTSIGRAGQVVVLRYPPPPNGRSTVTSLSHGVNLVWQDGLTTTDALFP